MDGLPFLSGETIKSQPKSLVSNIVDLSDCISHSTSGTTGTPKTTYHTLESQRKYWAAMNRFYRRGGVRYGDRRLSFTGNKIVPTGETTGPYGRYDRANNRYLMSSYHLGENTVDDYLDEIEQFQPDYIDGYPSSISYCAQRALETNRDIRIPAAFPTAETLREEDRELIEEGFSTQVYNQYGSTESAALITECPNGNWHVNPEIGIVEVLDEDGEPVTEGEIGELVLTGLNNKAMPLIRYRIGDMARGPPRYEACDCGWNTPVIEEIIGREDEVVITADGRRIPMLSYNVFKYAEGIEESQIVQESVDEFVLRIVPGDGYTDDQADLVTEKLKDRVGEDISVEVKLLDEIPKTSSGKFRAVISKV
nr:AMP-binding protein [Natrinema saccharevitans]